jgi:hypothetical protein
MACASAPMSRHRGEAATRRAMSPLGLTELPGKGPKPVTRRRGLKAGSMELTGLLPSYGQTGQERAVADNPAWEIAMTLGTILLIILILLLIGAIPNWGYSRGWGYGPSGIIGVILLIVIILLLMGRL